jgi:hypothetical protein
MEYENEKQTHTTVDKTGIMRGFNKHFFDFIDDIIVVFPENVEISAARESFETIRRANPTAIIKAWTKFVAQKYGERLMSGDLEYFLEKDYSEDLSNLRNSNKVIQIIDTLREPLKYMGDSNRAMSLKYLVNLCKLSVLYN